MESEGYCDSGFELGERVQTLNLEKSPQVGTVKYVGPVDGYAGIWIGVDWDSGQGRHNGTVNGKRYFETTGAESGSLVRSHNVGTGVTLIEALVRRYNASESCKGQDDAEMYVLSVRQRRMTVELVGKKKIEARQKELQQLQIASLAYAGVSSAGPPGQIRALAPNIQELDLTGNLLPDWLAVGKLCEELSSMQVLNLSCSRLRIPQNSVLPILNIRTLVLNNCCLTWKEVEQLKSCLSRLEELHLCGNKIQEIEATSQEASPSLEIFVEGFQSLRLLNLEDNCIKSWTEIMKLSKLSRLEHLNLNSNNISEVFYPGSFLASSAGKHEYIEGKVPFSSLRCLLLGKNMIADWASLDGLDKLPALEDLRLSENPITSPAAGGIPRYMLIARIQKLTSLNGSEVKPRERRDAEVRYVRHFLRSVAGGTKEEFEVLHPRLTELRLAHDVPMDSADHRAATTSQKMSATLLSVNIHCVSSSVGEKAPISKRLPPSTTVGKLKHICEALFKLKVAKQQLYVKDQDPLPMPLDNDMETLDNLGLGAGAVILVDEHDV